MNRLYCLIILLIAFGTKSNSVYSQVGGNAKNVSIQVDGAKRFQQIDGFGVNANTRSWEGEELKPALNLLLDSMHATIWRVVVETVYNWEDKNDNNDPFVFNWDYYDKLYSTPKFQKAWDMIGYLNKQGITNNLMIDFMGPIPLWMGGKVVKKNMKMNILKCLFHFFITHANTKHLQIGLISIMNEPDIENEGPTVGPGAVCASSQEIYGQDGKPGHGRYKICGS